MTKIENLVEELNKYNIEYYVYNSPSITDYEFDQKLKELEALEAQYPDKILSSSPTQRVGNDLTAGFEKVKRDIPMLSLRNTYTKQEIKDFVDTITKTNSSAKFVTDLKFDGVSVSVIYKKGELVQASTRGNGTVGDDITANIKAIRNVPLKLIGNYPDELEIRGEILMPFSSFNKINKERKSKGEQEFSNPRNAVSGTIKSLSSEKVYNRNLMCYFYFVEKGLNHIDSHFSRLKMLRSFGVPVHSFISLSNSISDIDFYIEAAKKNKSDFDFPIDGIVIKLDSYKLHSKFGETSKYPRWAIAYKYNEEEVSTKLISIINQVGKTGIVTPVALFDSIEIDNVFIDRATLHNYDFIKDLGLCYGDTIAISRGGEVIPKVTRVVSHCANATPIVSPTTCPICNTPLKKEKDSVGYFCTNKNCEGILIGKLSHFVGKDAMNIQGFGDSIINTLVQNGLIKYPYDFYSLTIENLKDIKISGKTKLGLKRATKLLTEIENSKTRTFDKVLYALNILNVGRHVSRDLAKKFGTIIAIMKAAKDEITSIDGIGETVYNSLQLWWKDENNKTLVTTLKNIGLQFENIQTATPIKTKLKGDKFVITGTFTKFTRKELTNLLEENGAQVSGSVSSKTTALIAGEKAGSKLKKAQTLGIKILNENDVQKMLI